MLDIDHFKQINDRYGHVAGDQVLHEVAAVIRESTRPEDLVARFGGEEFVVALPFSVPDLATERAERIRSNLAERTIIAEGHEIRVTASIGLAYAPHGRSRNDMALIMTADDALYRTRPRAETAWSSGVMRCNWPQERPSLPSSPPSFPECLVHALRLIPRRTGPEWEPRRDRPLPRKAVSLRI